MGVVVGGLGGGGDVGLAAVLVEDAGLQGRVEAVASFARCSARVAPPGLKRVRGALYAVAPEADLGRRVFEDKLRSVAAWARRVYIICAEDPWDDIVEALEWLATNHRVSCTLHADIGGDGLLTGYERMLGSYKVDTVARAALAYAAERLGWRAVIAVGAAGGEGGGVEIDHAELAVTLALLEERGAILGVVAPRPGSLWVADALLSRAESGMLPLYLQAARGAGRARINMAYLHGEYEVKPWYRYVILLDALRACRASPLCMAAMGRGLRGLSRWESTRRELDRRVERLYERARRARQRGGSGGVEEEIMRVVERHRRRGGLRAVCRV